LSESLLLLLLLLLLLSSLVDELSTSGLLPGLLVTSATDICLPTGGCPHVVTGLLVTLFVPLLELLLFLEETPEINIRNISIPVSTWSSYVQVVFHWQPSERIYYYACLLNRRKK
jgi:hypothetical protein